MNQVLRGKEEDLACSMLNEMSDMDISSEEFEKAMSSFIDLRKVINESEKIETELDIKTDQIELDTARLEMEKVNAETSLIVSEKSSRSDAIIKGVGIGVTLAADLIKLGAFGRFYHQGMEYERTDTYSTLATKGLAQKVSNLFRF